MIESRKSMRAGRGTFRKRRAVKNIDDMSELDAVFHDIGVACCIQFFVTVCRRIQPVEGVGNGRRIETFARQIDLALLECSGHLNLWLQAQKHRSRESCKV